MKVDAVFSGGGVKAYAYIGALQSIEKNGLEIERVAGTSAGALFASLLTANYSTTEITHLVDTLDLHQFLDAPIITKIIPFSKWFFLYFQKGLYKGNVFESWLRKHLSAKGINTFKDVKKNALKIIVSDLTLGKLVVIPDDLMQTYSIEPDQFSVATAVRMSAGFPYFFMPKHIKNQTGEQSVIVDGGLLSNFPLWVFEDANGRKRRPVLGVKLSSTEEEAPGNKIQNALDMFHALFSTMMVAHDARYVSKSKQNNIIFIPAEGVNPVNLNISDEEKERLIEMGQLTTDHFLKRWPK